MRRRDFYALPRSLQDRFIESSQGVAVPKPLLVAPESESESMRWAFAAAVALAAWAAFVFAGFGDLDSPLALGGPVHLGVHVLLASVASFTGLRSFSISWEASRSPYGSGAFLFPSGVIHARGRALVEYDAKDCQSVRAEGADVVVAFPAQVFRFRAADADAAKSVVSSFETGKSAWSGLEEKEALERARLNPLTDSGVPNPLAPTDAHARPVLFPLPVLVLLTAILGGALGAAVSYWRTSLSEKALYASAVEQNSVRAFRAYLERGGDRAQVAELLLPRAELTEAMKAGSIEAIVDFERRHRGSKIAGEVQGAIRSALLAQLDTAKQAGTLAALDELAKRYPDHVALIAPEMATARRDIYVRALGEFQKVASKSNSALVPFMQHLLGWVEQHGPRVEVRFHQTFDQDPKQLDSIVSKSREYYLGRKLLPTQYFLGARARARETELGKTIAERLSKAFPKEVLYFELGPLPGAENEGLPPAEVPVLVIDHAEKLSGGFVGGLPKGMYMGVALRMTATLTIPGSDEKLEFVFSAWRSPVFAVLSDKTKDIPDVYQHMMSTAFDEFEQKYLASWFDAP